MVKQNILHYKILGKLGEGGMGVVYKAEDTKLERTVALKFLSTGGIGEEEKKRFKREAKAAAALNHPNIAHVYAIDEADDQIFIAMEYIEGQSLAELVAGNPGMDVKSGNVGAKHSWQPSESKSADPARNASPLPLDDAINYTIQIADGLQAAHEKGIIHRDVKSANIMVTEKGRIKIMDFGLAKLGDRSMLTQMGSTLGTAAYMSPEQAGGETVDQRSDIWSLGVVLYEMISGQLPFKGGYEQATLYAIMNEEPEPLTALRSGLPIAIDGIIAKALAKDPATRYQHVDELPADLRGLETAALSKSRIQTGNTSAFSPQPARNGKLPWIVTAAVTLIFSSLLWYVLSSGSEQTPNNTNLKRLKLSITPGDWLDGDFAVSPDDNALVFRTSTGSIRQLYYRSLSSEEAVPLPGTEFARGPFFSPDGKWIGFVSEHALWKIKPNGSALTKICEARFSSRACWGDNDQIVFSQTRSEKTWQLLKVSANGGKPAPLGLPEPETNYYATWPQFLPGARALLYEATSLRGMRDNASIMLHNLVTGETRTIIENGAKAQYASTGHIIYAWEGYLWAVPFDIESLTVYGNAVVVAEDIHFSTDDLSYYYAISQKGSLFYAKQAAADNSNLVWVARAGVETIIPAAPRTYWDPRVSPDGRRVAVNVRNEAIDIWVYDLDRGGMSRLTHANGEDETPFWSPDGKWVAYASDRSGQPRSIFKTLADGSGKEELLWSTAPHTHVDAWSPDSKSILLTVVSATNLPDLWMLNLEAETVAKPLLQTAYTERNGRISPDGRWFAYESNESGRLEVYVQAYPELGKKILVSTNGGQQPIWRQDGKELFYRGTDSLMMVGVQPGEILSFTTPKALFRDEYGLKSTNHSGYSVSNDGKRLLMLKGEPMTGITQLEVVINWFDEIKQKAPADN